MGKQLDVNPLFFSLDKSQCVGWIKTTNPAFPLAGEFPQVFSASVSPAGALLR
jgi:hypothetical protein|tara:strand:- start:49 stop:207 length:159 start_codon:yes stop_codon:yes gene_type:complete